MACAGFNTAEGRIVPLHVIYDDDAIVVTLGVRPPAAPGSECPGVRPTEFRLTLDERIGHRVVLDGSAFPPLWRGQGQ